MSTDSDRLASALAEVTALKAENDRLRSLLGLDRPLLAEPAAAWEPTLFAESKADRSMPRQSGPSSRATALVQAVTARPAQSSGRVVA